MRLICSPRSTCFLLVGLLCLCSHSFRVSRGLFGHSAPVSSVIVLRESLADAKVDKLEPGDVSTGVEVAGEAVQTAAGGRRHTEESKRKIAKANKGKKPWNAGKKHSPETKARIAERTRIAMAKRKQEKLLLLGMTAQEYEASRAKAAREKRKAKAKGGLTEEGRKRISESVKKRWQDPGYRERYALANKGNRNHSAETKAKISAAIKAKWEDVEYRAKVNTSAHRPSEEVRNRISATLKKRWQEPEFRERMLNNTHERSHEWREKVSGKIKALWSDPEYRKNVEDGIMKSSSKRTVRSGGRGRGPSRKSRAGSRSQKKQKESMELKRRARAYALGSTHLLLRSGEMDSYHSLKRALGPELWFEEKMRRKTQAQASIMSDEELEDLLSEELKSPEGCLPLLQESGLSTVSEAVRAQVLSAVAGKDASCSIDWVGLVKEGDKASKKASKRSTVGSSKKPSPESSSVQGQADGETGLVDSFYASSTEASLSAEGLENGEGGGGGVAGGRVR